MSYDYNSIGAQHRDIMRRCYDPKSHIYKYYGEVGITVCNEWHDRENFKAWSLENGFQKGLRLNRYDSTKGYCPENCYWGERNNAKHGYNELVRSRAKANKERKAEIGLKRLTDSPVHGTYRAMHHRCEHEGNKNYGDRGITVCPEWSGKDGLYNFLEWTNSSNWVPGKSLDRIDVNKGYSPDNCRWATWEEQARNKRNSRKYSYNGIIMHVADIAQMEGVPFRKLAYRINKGMSVEEAIDYLKNQ